MACSLWAADGTWTAGTGGDWSDTDNWQDVTPAEGSTFTAFLNAGTGTITNDMTDLALLGVQFAGGGYTLAGNTITLDSAGFITVLADSHTVRAPLVLSGATTLTLASGQTLNLDGALSGDGGLTMYGGRSVLGTANTYAGPTVLVTGTLEVASVDALGSSAGDSANLILGEGTFRYTGPSATLSRGYTLIPGVSSNRAAVIDIPDAGTTLTVAGKVAAPGGAFIKTGEGTVAYTYPGYQELNKSKLSNKENGQITYDVNGVAATNEYAIFVVEKGRMILGAPGQTNLVYSSSGWVGCKTLASPRLDIIGGMTRFINGYFTIGRGTGTTASPQSPSMYISNNAYVTIEGSGLVMDNAHGQANHRCRPLLDINHATLRVDNDVFLSEDGNATSVVNVANSGMFISNSQNPLRGMCISQSAGAKTDVTVDSGSTGTVYMLRVGRGGTLNVIGSSVFEMDGTPTNAVTQLSNLGTARFSGGLLKQRTAKRSSDWFARLSTLLVGADDMTVDVSSHAWMDASAKEDPASPGGKIIKTGLGTLAPRAAGVDIQAEAGRIAMSVDHAYVTNGLSGTLAMAAGTALEVSGANALADMTVTPGTTPFIFAPHSLSSKPDLWRYNGYSMRRWDGLLRLTPDIGGQAGSTFMYRKFAVGSPWTATFAYLTWSTGATPADGLTFAIHNDPRGAGAIGTGGANLGYAGTPCVTNSVGVGIDVYLKRLRFGRQGYFLVNTANDSIPAIAATPVKTRFTVSYDGTGLLTVDLAGSDLATYRRFTYPVDVAAEVGGTEAYVGFAAGTGGSMGQHSITDFTFENGATPPVAYCRHGGNLTLASGETLNALLQPSAQQNGFVFGKLAYGDQSVIDIAAPHATADLPLPTLADQGLWKLNGVARWTPSGGLALSTNAASQPKGSAFLTNRYPIAGSWVARFGYDLGQANATPADYFTFALQNSGITTTAENPNPGLSLMWRYYDGAIRTTQLKIYTNGVLMTVASTNIVPVDLKNGAHANMTVAYDAPGATLTVTTSQEGAGTNVTVITGIDLSTVLRNVSSSYIGFTAATGGSYAENIITDFSFTGDALSAAWPKPGYLAFDKMSGSGTLVKRGNGALGLMGDVDKPTSNAVVRLENGGLVLRKNSLEPLDFSGARSEWVFSALGLWADDSTLQVCPNALYVNGTGTSARRVCVSNAWTATFSFLFGANSNPPADAFAMFFHNDPRGPGISSGNTATAGFAGMANSLGLRWCFYPGHPAVISNKVSMGRNGVWNDASGLSYLPVILKNGVTDFVVKYNPGAATLTAVLTQGATVVTNIFSGVNIPADVGGNYAYVGFGGGTGGASGEMRIRDFRLTYDQPVDTLEDQSYLAHLLVPDAASGTVTLDTSLPDSTFKVTAATVGDGAMLSVNTLSQPGVLAISDATQTGDATYAPAAGCTLALTDVTGGGTVTKTGAGTLALAGTVADYSGDTVLSAGTLSLASAVLPTATDLYVTTGAALNLDFEGKQYIHSLFLDGVMMPGGIYTAANATWITGTGKLVVTYPPVGTMILLR
jgi:autotransporter-associated beta strand protein